MTMLERMCRDWCARVGDPETEWRGYLTNLWELVESMKDPPESICMEGIDTACHDAPPADWVWNAMIDAILTEEPK